MMDTSEFDKPIGYGAFGVVWWVPVKLAAFYLLHMGQVSCSNSAFFCFLNDQSCVHNVFEVRHLGYALSR